MRSDSSDVLMNVPTNTKIMYHSGARSASHLCTSKELIASSAPLANVPVLAVHLDVLVHW